MRFSDFVKFEENWPITNRERGILIDKSISGGLTAEEHMRLEALQTYAEYYVEKTSPRPTGELDALEKRLFSGAPSDRENGR